MKKDSEGLLYWFKLCGLIFGVSGLIGSAIVGGGAYALKAIFPDPITIKSPSAIQVAQIWQCVPAPLPPINSAYHLHSRVHLKGQFIELYLTATPTLSRQITKALSGTTDVGVIHNPGENPSAPPGTPEYGYPWHVGVAKTRLPNGNDDIKIHAIQFDD